MKANRVDRLWMDRTTDPRHPHWAEVTIPDRKAAFDRTEMLSAWHHDETVKPDATYTVAGFVAKLWGAADKAGACVSLQFPSGWIWTYRLPDKPGRFESEPATELLGTARRIVDANFRSARQSILAARRSSGSTKLPACSGHTVKNNQSSFRDI